MFTYVSSEEAITISCVQRKNCVDTFRFKLREKIILVLKI